ncbi:MAG: aminotransferase class V-fold PLP-dependent enzyme [Acidobacteria bacterium]|jgi:selenocysteine lyase/cysteine desulfurase|nr:MAG: aminotransferase class V-fold PLP-dependent enzyme [Acidobacteriota bacterium]GIU81782.1 MAG: cysteine desulfurase [Pyrinomonadaceae bacterium]
MDEEIRKLFPAVEKYAYLNNAAVAPIPVVAIEAVLSQLRDVSENGSLHYSEWIATKERARKLVAEMLKVRPDDIAFMRNTSDALSSVAMGLDWAEGDNIVTFEGEFPSNFYPWRMIRDRFGVELRVSKRKGGLVDVDDFVSLIDANTKLVAISFVQFDTGFRCDLERIGQIARKHDALFVVDIIQGFGALELDLPSQFVDVAAGASHKWLCAPEGCGILYLCERARERIQPSVVGWISVEDVWDFDNKEQVWKPNTKAWESGTSSLSLFYGLEQSLNLLNKVGVAKIEKYLEELTDSLCSMLVEKGYRVLSSRLKGEKSQIVSILPKEGWTDVGLVKFLEKQNIIVSARNGLVRIAPHFFNNLEDLQNLIQTLP